MATTISSKVHTCVRCNEIIAGGTFLRIEGKTYHRKCFVCSECKKVLAPPIVHFKMDDGTLLCQEHFQCDKCSRPIDSGSQYIQVKHLKYHTACFDCSVCHRPIASAKFYIKGNLPVCETHARKA